MKALRYRRILVATDGSRRSLLAARHAVHLAARCGASILAVTTTPRFSLMTLDPRMADKTPERYRRYSERRAGKVLEAVTKLARAARVACSVRHVVEDHPHKAILRQAARSHCDLIVMGSHGRGAAPALVLGSETLKVISRSRVPVLVCRSTRA